VCGLIALCCACEPPLPPETESFEAAEVAYRKGSYQEAIDGYESFLRHYPASPLARIARLRLRAINREVGAVLKRHDMPTPEYREPSPKGSEK
jgi:hypothetical protein